MENVRELEVDTRYVTGELFASSLSFGKNSLTSTNDDVNTLMNNAVFHHYLKALRRQP